MLNNSEEAYRLAAWLQEGAFYKMTLGDVEKAGRLLIHQDQKIVEMAKQYKDSMAHQNNQYNKRVAERDMVIDALKSAIYMLERDHIDFAKMEILEKCYSAIDNFQNKETK